MSMIDKNQLNQIIESEWSYLLSEAGNWSLLRGEQDMEILEHVLRCILHVGNASEHGEDFAACVDVQNSDGGWSKMSHEEKTSIWITTFVGLKLCRGNLILKNQKIEMSIQRALKYILSSQEDDGHWSDVEWSHLDTTCSVTVFLTVYQVTHNQKNDDLAFERIINVPKRSIGDSTVKQLHDWSRKNKKSLEDSAIDLIQLNKIKPKAKLGLVKILGMFNKWRSDLKKKKHYELMEIILDESGYSKMLKDKKDLESEGRLENLKELIRGMHEFDNLQGFLEHVALATSIDQDWKGQKVNLMTMHAAKGLEFDVVFLPGWEEGLFPHQKSIEEKGQKGLEEERRLAYVGITRAKKSNYIFFNE